jgi:hypothetical protein
MDTGRCEDVRFRSRKRRVGHQKDNTIDKVFVWSISDKYDEALHTQSTITVEPMDLSSTQHGVIRIFY